MHFLNLESLFFLLHVATMKLSSRGRSRVCTAGPRLAGWPPYLPYPPIYLKDSLAPATDPANPYKP